MNRPGRRLATAMVAVAGALCGLVRQGKAAEAPQPPKLRLPATAAPIGYAIDLTLDPGRDDFRGTAEIEIQLKGTTDLLWLNATDLKVEKATAVVGGKSAAVRPVPGGADFVGLAFDGPVGPGAMQLRVDYTGLVSRSSTQGLFRQQDGEDWYLFSQFEDTDARRAFPCFDEPSYKVPWQLTVRIPKGTSAVSNTPIASQADDAGGARVVRFARTQPLPSYLVAVGVGPFEYVDGGRAGTNRTPIRIVTPRGKSAQARYAAEVTGPLLERLESYFGIPYPYEKLDHLAIPQTVTFGAMENAGLVTWASRALLAPPGEEAVRFRRTLASYGAHEMAHQWFGDLVTLAWWDDVWLNESFATWMETKTLMAWKPEWNEEFERLAGTSRVMVQDSLVSARKIRQEILGKDDIVNAFDAVTYQKGGAVLAMFEAWVGEERFRDGVHKYLEAHRHGSATSRDFLQALESSSQPGVAAAFSTFLDQPGVPLLDVSVACGGGRSEVGLGQKRLLPQGSAGSATAQLWQIPVCGRAAAIESGRRECVLLTEAAKTLPMPGACPDWFFANDGQTGYYRVHYAGDLMRGLLSVAGRELSLAERVGLIRDTGALAAAGAVPIGEALALVPRFAPDPSRHVVEAAHRIALDAREHLPEDLLPSYARFVTTTFGERARALGFKPGPTDDDDRRLLRSLLVPFAAGEGQDAELEAEATRLATLWTDDRTAIDPELTASVLVVAARRGDEALFQRFREAAKKAPVPQDRERLFIALGSFADRARVQDAVSLFLSDEFNPLEARRILYGAASIRTRAFFWDAFKARYDEIIGKLPPESGASIPYFWRGFCDADHRRDVAAFFKDRAAKLPGAPRALAQTLETIDLCVAARVEQEPGLRRFLEAY